MVGRRGKRGAASATTASPATRSARNPPTTHAPRARGRGRGRGRWANYWANRPGRPSTTARTEDQEESPIPPKRSHILKFKLPSLRKLGLFSSDNASSTDQADAFSTAPASTSAGSQNPETPRGRRSKRAMAVPESSRTTRQSARLKPSEELATEEATPSKLAEDVDSEAEAEADADVIADADADATEDEEDSSSQEEADQEDLAYTPKLRLRLSPPKPPALKLHFTSANKATDPDHPEASTEDQAMPEATESRQKDSQGADDEPYSAQLTEPPQTSYSPRLSRKRKSTEMKDEAQEFESAEMPEPSGTAAKKLKLEEPEPEPESTPNGTLQNGNPTESPQSQESTPDHGAIPDPTRPDPAVAPSIEGPATSGRGRGRGRGRARGRGSRGSRGGAGGRGGALGPTRGAGVRGRGGRGRGRGRGSAAAALRRGGKRIEDEIWDSESRRRTPSPVRATQPIKDRAEELAALFKKVGQAQQLALSVLADHSMQKIARDKNAHKESPEYDQILRELGEYERKALTRCRDQYDLKVESAEKVYAGNVLIVEQRTQERIANIQEEMFFAARGKYMELVSGRRAAEDDEHTETDGSDAEAEEPRYLFRIGKAGLREVERGFFAEAVRQPDGAAAFERGEQEWEDFVMKVRLGEDLNPQMQALDSSIEASTDSINRAVDSLLQAARTVADSYDGPSDVPKALSLLADTALFDHHPATTTTHFPQMRPDQHLAVSHRALFPQPQGVPQPPPPPPPPPGMAHGPTDPRSFILPRPTPTQQPRRLLPARSPLGMGLPDPFAMTGPPQLPPPPGSNFHRLPLPSWPPGPPGQAGQQPGPGSTGSHGGPGPHGGPPPLYFPPPPPRRY